MGRLLKVIVLAVLGLFAVIAGLFGALLLGVAALFGLVKKPTIHVRTAGGGAGAPRGPSQARGPAAAGDVIDVETTKVESPRELR
jgi:hypothetical protein